MAGRRRRLIAPQELSALERWAAALEGIDCIDLRRTSNRSKRDFDAQLVRAANGRPDDPDVRTLASYGHAIVLPEGEPLRQRLGAFTITRGSIDGNGSKAVLGWAIPIGRTLFFLYLQSARKNDIQGATPDRDQNAFAEGLSMTVRGVRPEVLYTPLLNRVFRSTDHAVPTMRTLRTFAVRLVAAGEHIRLETDDDRFVAQIRMAMADKDAAGDVQRLEGDNVSLLTAGDWYLGAGLLPFTWQPMTELVRDPETGVQVSRVVDGHSLQVAPRAAERLALLVELGGQPRTTRHAIAVALGQTGVISRAPQHSGKFVTLDKLKTPSTAVDSLISPEWVRAWRTGVYEKEYELTSDLRRSYPTAPIRQDEDGRFWLRVKLRMPAPEGGWGISDKQWRRFEEVQFAQTPQRVGRQNANNGVLRPLLGVGAYQAEGVQRNVLGFESGSYQLVERPAELAMDGSTPRAWGKEAVWAASVHCGAWHADVARALDEIADLLAGADAPLLTPCVPPPGRQPTATTERIATLQTELAARRKRLTEMQLVQDAVAASAAGMTTEQTEIIRRTTEASVADAQRDVETTQAQLDDLLGQGRPVARAMAPPPSDTGDGDLSTLVLVAQALRRCRGSAPVALNRLLSRLVHDLRWQVIAHATAVRWTATVRVPLLNGRVAESTITGLVPTSHAAGRAEKRTSAGRRRDLPRRAPALAADHAATYAQLLFVEGKTIAEIEQLRGLHATGGSAGQVYRSVHRWLLEHGVASPDLARAALDIQVPEARRALYAALTRTPADDSELARWMGDIYRRGLPSEQGRITTWGVLWCAARLDKERRIIATLLTLAEPGAWVSAARVCEVADLPYVGSGRHAPVGVGDGLLEIVNGGRRSRAPGGRRVIPAFLDKDWQARDPRSPEHNRVRLRRCPHRHCDGHLVPLPVPEIPDGLLCSSCRRAPGQDLVMPCGYLRPWSGGRRTSRTGAAGLVGTVCRDRHAEDGHGCGDVAT